jgi:hypothetical protein
VLSLDLVRFGAGWDVADFLDQRAAVLVTYGIGVPLVCAVVSMAVTAFEKGESCPLDAVKSGPAER